MEFIAMELSPDSYVNLMAQYMPAHRAFEYPELARPPTYEEYLQGLEYATEAGIHRGIPFSR